MSLPAQRSLDNGGQAEASVLRKSIRELRLRHRHRGIIAGAFSAAEPSIGTVFPR